MTTNADPTAESPDAGDGRPGHLDTGDGRPIRLDGRDDLEELLAGEGLILLDLYTKGCTVLIFSSIR